MRNSNTNPVLNIPMDRRIYNLDSEFSIYLTYCLEISFFSNGDTNSNVIFLEKTNLEKKYAAESSFFISHI